MIPILFESGTTDFNTNGLGRLRDCVSCTVTEERNGIYECEFEYPISGVNFEQIQIGRIISCAHDDRGDYQPFIIYKREIPDLRGIVKFHAHHISYMLSDIVVMPFTASSVGDALNKIKTYSANTNPFAFWTDKNTTVSYTNDIPRIARNMLGGEQNSILDVFGGGEYEFNNFEVKLYANRGIDSGVEIRYAKNLSNLKQDLDNSGTYNAAVPYWTDSEGHIVTLPEKYITYTGIDTSARIDAAPMDLSGDFEEKPTVAQLRSRAKSKLDSGKAWLPTDNLTVDFVALWQTEEYKELAGLQRVSLCDTVSVYYPPAGVYKVKQKVIRTVYNVLLDRYDSIELGTLQASLGQAIKQDMLEIVPTTSMMEQAIKYASDMIRGGLGGYVVMTPGENGYPQEILIMDTPDINTAVNVWRFNQGGLGHSHNGYNGPFSDIALTADGKINANLITVGTLNADIIKAGTLSDQAGNTSLNLVTGVFSMKKGSITLGNGNFSVTDAGLIAIKSGSINLGNGKFVVTDTGNLTASLGTIGPFTLSNSGLSYNSSSMNISINSSNITYMANEGSYRRGIRMNGNALIFLKRSDQSSWSLSEIGRIEMSDVGASTGDPEFFFLLHGNSAIRARIGVSNNKGFLNVDRLSTGSISATLDCVIYGDLNVYGTKSRVTQTENYSNRLLYCYETPTPLFGDIGEAQLDEEGICYVDIDDIFTETIAEQVEYQVFLQKEGEGDCWIASKTPRYFIIQGTPNLKVAWELKAKQRDYENIRLEPLDRGLEEYANISDDNINIKNYIKEQEDILYG